VNVVTLTSSIRRIPIRVRVSLTLAIVLALVLLASGLFLDLRFAALTKGTIDDSLRSRAGDVVALVGQADSGLRSSGRSPLRKSSAGFAEILDSRGAIFDATPQLGRQPVLSAGERAAAARSPRFFDHGSISGVAGPVRLLAVPVHAQGKSLIVVVGTGLTERNAALRNLRALLLLAGAGALILATLAGYLAVAAALRPVESMRRRAEEINEAHPGLRLPVAPADDEVGRLGSTLNSMLDHLEQALTRERTFVTDASHELRTPISILKAEFELALSSNQSRDSLERALRSASEETQRLGQLAEDLLLMSRDGETSGERANTSVRELFASVQARYANQVKQLGREIVLTDSDGLQVVADRPGLERALTNLVDNALRHGRGPIMLRARREAGTLELHVQDEGPGFPEDFLPRAFDRFSRAEAGRSTQGTGLGLAIVAAVAAAHGGAAHAANVAGGTDVWLAIPDADPASNNGEV
jgi:two-component system, OmpR family, sensor kinase